MNERPTLTQAVPVSFTLNGIARSVASAPGERLSEVVRRGLGLTGTKVGCNAGDCGAASVRRACSWRPPMYLPVMRRRIAKQSWMP